MQIDGDDVPTAAAAAAAARAPKRRKVAPAPVPDPLPSERDTSELRSKSAVLLAEAVEDDTLLFDVGVSLESALHDLHPAPAKAYTSAVRMLVASFKRNAELRASVRDGRVTPEALVRAEPGTLAPHTMRNHIAALEAASHKRCVSQLESGNVFLCMQISSVALAGANSKTSWLEARPQRRTRAPRAARGMRCLCALGAQGTLGKARRGAVKMRMRRACDCRASNADTSGPNHSNDDDSRSLAGADG